MPDAITRRSFLRTGGALAAGAVAGVAGGIGRAPAGGQGTDPAAAAAAFEEVIDIHQHTNYAGRLNPALVRHQEVMGATRTVLLPAGMPVSRASTNGGSANGLAARILGTGGAMTLAEQFPDRFVFFANEVPDLGGAPEILEKWLDRGAAGIGELKFGIDCDGGAMRRVFDMARAYEVPVLLHFEHGAYNHGFHRFHRILEAYPTVNFIGHAQTWWGFIDKAHDPRDKYPKTPVLPGGLTDRYLADYPNVFGDLSAGSGRNALTRDPEHAAAFLARHRDKLLFGSDCNDSAGQGSGCIGAGTLELLRHLVPDPADRHAILAGNARRIIRI